MAACLPCEPPLTSSGGAAPACRGRARGRGSSSGELQERGRQPAVGSQERKRSGPSASAGNLPSRKRTAREAEPAVQEEARAAQELQQMQEWGENVFQTTCRISRVEPLVPWQSVSSDGPFLAFGRIVCTDYHVMIETHVTNRNFHRAGLSLNPEESCFPHMTLARLEEGRVERIGNVTWWSRVDLAAGKINMTRLTCEMSERLRRDSTVFRLIPAHVHQDFSHQRYRITGGEGLLIFRRLQLELQQACVELDEGSVSLYSEPHVSYKYGVERQDWPWEAGDNEGAGGRSGDEGDSSSISSSLQEVLVCLSQHKLEKLRNIFIQHRLSASILPSLSDEDLVKAGISAVGDRKRVGKLVAHLVQGS